MNNYDKNLAKLDPTKVYKTPRAIMEDSQLSRAEKIDILNRWAYDEREISVAEEENMQGAHESYLDEILKCLLELKVDTTEQRHPPTKQG